MTAIEKQIDQEFEKWCREIGDLYEKIEKAEERYNAPKLSDKDSKRLRQLYRQLVLKLHPDLNPNFPSGMKNLWLRVVDAYKAGDLKEMEILSTLADDCKGIETYVAPSLLEEKCSGLQENIKNLINRPDFKGARPGRRSKPARSPR